MLRSKMRFSIIFKYYSFKATTVNNYIFSILVVNWPKDWSERYKISDQVSRLTTPMIGQFFDWVFLIFLCCCCLSLWLLNVRPLNLKSRWWHLWSVLLCLFLMWLFNLIVLLNLKLHVSHWFLRWRVFPCFDSTWHLTYITTATLPSLSLYILRKLLCSDTM